MTDPIETLGRLVDANRAAGRNQMFVLTYPGGPAPELVGHPGWQQGSEAPTTAEVDDMADRGWVQIVDIEGKRRHFALTDTGRNAWAGHLLRIAPATGHRVSLDWGSAGPVLRDVLEVYQNAGAPAKGVDVVAIAASSDDPSSTEVHVRELAHAGFLEVTFESAAGPRLVRPSPTALQMLAGRPADTAEDTLQGLVRALDTEIEHTSDPDRRSTLKRVRSGLLGAARDVALAYLEKKVMGL
jgi:hypothetical protein